MHNPSLRCKNLLSIVSQSRTEHPHNANRAIHDEQIDDDSVNDISYRLQTRQNLDNGTERLSVWWSLDEMTYCHMTLARMYSKLQVLSYLLVHHDFSEVLLLAINPTVFTETYLGMNFMKQTRN